jgi:hypothetical protein
MDVMVQVESALKTNNPLDTVNQMLADFKTAVNSEQMAHDDLYGRQKKECDGEIEFRRKEVGDATKTLAAANQQLNQCSVQKGKANAELGTTKDQLIMYRQHLDLVQDVRRIEQENFSGQAVVNHDAMNAIEDCLDLTN